MKKLLIFLACVTLFIVACNQGPKTEAPKADSITIKDTTKIVDTIKVDTIKKIVEKK